MFYSKSMTKKARIATIVSVTTVVAIVAIILAFTTLRSYDKTASTSRQQKDSENTSTAQQQASQFSCIQKLPNQLKLHQKLMVAGYTGQLASQTSFFASANIGGIILMDEVPADQIGPFRSANHIAPFIATDQEGGTVQRYKTNGELPGATDMANGYSIQQAYAAYLKDAQYLRSVGITTNLAPVLGVRDPAVQSALPGRMYGTDAATVTKYANALATADQAVGITPVVKHFPGLGTASGNTDYGPAATNPLASLRGRDEIPFQKLAVIHPDAMVSNAIVPDLTHNQPAVWSPEAVALLRSFGYQNAVVYSDSLTAKAIPGTLSDAVVKAWQAGIDVSLFVQTSDHTADLPSYLGAIDAAAQTAVTNHTLSQTTIDQSVVRIFARKKIDACRVQ